MGVPQGEEQPLLPHRGSNTTNTIKEERTPTKKIWKSLILLALIPALIFPFVRMPATLSRAKTSDRDELEQLRFLLDQVDSSDQFQGRIVWREDGLPFHEAARVWRRDIQPPLVVIEVGNERDVQLVVPVLAQLDFPVRIRSGGHSKAGFSSVEDGIVLSLKHMNRATVLNTTTDNSSTYLVQVQPGATVEDVYDQLLEPHGIAGATGQCGHVAEGGWVLGGGVGSMARLLGLGIDNVMEFRVVLADGRAVVANHYEHADLFWALRGAGSGNYGVVTSMTYRMYPTPREQRFQAVPVPLETFASTLTHLGNSPPSDEFFAVFIADSDDKVTMMATWSSLDAGTVAQGDERFRQELSPYLYEGGNFRANNATDEVYQEVDVASWTHLIFDKPASYSTSVWAAQAWQGFLMPENNTQEVWDVILGIMMAGVREAGPSLETHIELWGGQISRAPTNSTAFPYREAVYNVGVQLVVYNQSQDEYFHRQASRINQWWSRVQEYLTGSYLNYPMNSLSKQEYPHLYWGPHLERLVKIKQKYDPENFFEYEQSMPTAVK